MRIFIVFRDTIYANGLRTTLAAAPGVEAADQASSIALAWEHDALASADVILLESDLGGASGFVRDVSAALGARILICVNGATPGAVVDLLPRGDVGTTTHAVAGLLTREQMTPDTLVAAVNAIAAGIFALDAGIVRVLTSFRAVAVDQRLAEDVNGRFTAREQMVLRLVAAGLSNREIAERLSYSERTIKTVLHDVVTKLGVKSRSHAVAMAVRERMI